VTQATERIPDAVHELLGRGGPREILSRIVPGDPLQVRPRAARRIRARALLLDAERATLRALALIAARAARWRGRPRLDLWLEARVDEALDELLDEERDGPPRAAAPADPIAVRLGLLPEALARGRARFHALALEDRDAFHRLVLEAGSLDETARALGVGAPELARRARRGLLAFTAGEARP